MTDDSERDRAVEKTLPGVLRRAAAPESSACLDAETLAAWTAGTLPASEASAITRHVADCARCQELVAVFAATEPATAAPPDSGRLWLRWVLPLASVAAVAFAIWMGRVLNAPTPVTENARVEAPQAAPSTPRQTQVADPMATRPSTISAARQGQGNAPRPQPPAPRANAAAPRKPAASPTAGTPPMPGGGGATIGAGSAAPAPPPPAPVQAPPRFNAPVTTPPPPPPPAAYPTPPPPSPVTADQSTRVLAAPPPPAPEPAPVAQGLAGAPPRVISEFSSADLSRDAVDAVSAVGTVGGGLGRAGQGGRGGGGGGARGGGAQGATAKGGTAQGGTTAVNAASAPPIGPFRWRIFSDGHVERSIDQGGSWTRVTLPNSPFIVAGAAPDSTACWLGGRGGAVVVTVGGTTFIRVDIPGSADVTSIRATTPLNATVTTADGRTFTTTDGGVTWR